MVPKWTGVFEKWTRQWAHRNHWRVKALLDEDDLVQECAVMFSHCANRYRDTVTNAAWFMSLYQRACANRLHTLSVSNTRYDTTAQDYEVGTLVMAEGATASDHYATLSIGITQCSAEARQVLSVMANTPAEMWDMLFAPRPDAVLNRRIKRLCRITTEADVVGELRSLLT
jgi:hypothetical protein